MGFSSEGVNQAEESNPKALRYGSLLPQQKRENNHNARSLMRFSKDLQAL